MPFVPAVITLGSSFLATQGFKLGSLRDALRPRVITLGSSFLATQGFKLGSLRDALRPRADHPLVARSSQPRASRWAPFGMPFAPAWSPWVARSSQPRASIWAPFGMPFVPALITQDSSFLAILGFKLGSLRDASGARGPFKTPSPRPCE